MPTEIMVQNDVPVEQTEASHIVFKRAGCEALLPSTKCREHQPSRAETELSLLGVKEIEGLARIDIGFRAICRSKCAVALKFVKLQ